MRGWEGGGVGVGEGVRKEGEEERDGEEHVEG